MQVAVLYTSPEGSRRVRVVNLALQVADLAGNVFRMADADAVVCHLTKEGASAHNVLYLWTAANLAVVNSHDEASQGENECDSGGAERGMCFNLVRI